MSATTPLAKIDCHAHYVPDFYREALVESDHAKPDGMPSIPDWNVEDHLAMMDQLNITKAILSISSPGVHLIQDNDTAGVKLARRCNDYVAQLKKTNPTRLGYWASLPLKDESGSLAEIAHALDDINADGFTVETNYDGVYLGDTKYETIFAELNRRQAKIFIHPTTPCSSVHGPAGSSASTRSANPLAQYPSPLLEFFFDTARAVANLFISGTIERFPNITYVIPHAGGALPPLINRFSYMAAGLGLTDQSTAHCTIQNFPAFVKDRLKTQFYFDTAGWSLPEPLKDLLQYVPVERIVYGSDYPWSPLQAVTGLSQAHDRILPVMFPNSVDVKKVCSGNASRLLEGSDSALNL